jgi:hypothetical protein
MTAPTHQLGHGDGPTVAIVTPLPLCDRHGTGSQVLRIFAGRRGQSWSLYWLHRPGFVSVHPASARLQHLPRLKRLRGGRLVSLAERSVGASWWRGNEVDGRRLRRLLDDRGWRCDVAYVCPSNEEQAECTASILDVLGCPYVAHLWDLCHDDGLDPDARGGYRRLIAGASEVLALNEAIAEQVEGLGAERPRIVRFGQEPIPRASRPPTPETLRLVMVGSIGGEGNPALRVLVEAWPAIREMAPGARLVYLGQHHARMDERLRRIVTHPGLLDAEGYQRELASSHVAFLPSPDRLDCFGRFSLPSRVSDYLMAGLPVAARVGAGTATERFLAPLTPAAVRMTHTAEELAAAVRAWMDEEAWHAASDAARAFAEAHFAIDAVRERVFAALDRAIRSDPNRG